MKQFAYRLFIAILPAIAVGWWYLVSKVAVWMWFELFATRHLMGVQEANITFIALVAISLTAIPQFYWVPVHLYKLLYLSNKELEHEQFRHYLAAGSKKLQAAQPDRQSTVG